MKVAEGFNAEHGDAAAIAATASLLSPPFLTGSTVYDSVQGNPEPQRDRAWEKGGRERGREESPSASSTAVPFRPLSARGGTPTSRGASGSDGLLAAIRREIKACEDRLSARVMNCERRVEQFRDAAFAAIKDNFAELARGQPEYDRRLSEMGGTVQGVHNELQTLVQRMSGMDLAQSQRQNDLNRRIKVIEESTGVASLNSEALKVSLAQKLENLELSMAALQVQDEDMEKVQINANLGDRSPYPGFGGGAEPMSTAIMEFNGLPGGIPKQDGALNSGSPGGVNTRIEEILQQLQIHQGQLANHEQRIQIVESQPSGPSVGERLSFGAEDRFAVLDEHLASLSSVVGIVEQGVKKHSTDISDINRKIEDTHWVAILEIKNELLRVYEHFCQRLKAIKEDVRMDGSRRSSLENIEGDSAEDTQTVLLREASALAESIRNGILFLQKHSPHLLEDCEQSGADLTLMTSANDIEDAASVGDDCHQPEDFHNGCTSPPPLEDTLSPNSSMQVQRASTAPPATLPSASRAPCFAGCLKLTSEPKPGRKPD